MHDDPTSPPQAPLNGWKEIAAYLGKSVRSVQRWEAVLGLPVHRIRTPDGQIVYGIRHEIDAWRQALGDSPTTVPHEAEDHSRPSILTTLPSRSGPVATKSPSSVPTSDAFLDRPATAARDKPAHGGRAFGLAAFVTGLVAGLVSGLVSGWWLASL